MDEDAIEAEAMKRRSIGTRPLLFANRFLLGTDMAIGCLDVCVDRAEKLPAADFGGTSDPYVLERGAVRTAGPTCGTAGSPSYAAPLCFLRRPPTSHPHTS